MIPKIIHQTWKSRELPPDYARYRDSVVAKHPDWEHRLWTDRDNRALIADHYDWFLPTYDGYAHEIERVDAVRYFILLRFGGLYLDLDMECLRPLDGLLKHPERAYFSLLASPTPEDAVIGNAFMAARPGYPFFAYLTRQLPKLISSDVTYEDIFNNTGPNMLTRQLQAFEPLSPYELLPADAVCDRSVLPRHPVYRHMSREELLTDGRLYLLHHHTNSWNVQHPAPEPVPAGFVLLSDHDIHGFDLSYVEYSAGDYTRIAEACLADNTAIGFNFNGFIKGRGVPMSWKAGPGDHWLNPGIRPWVCLREDYFRSLVESGQISERKH